MTTEPIHGDIDTIGTAKGRDTSNGRGAYGDAHAWLPRLLLDSALAVQLPLSRARAGLYYGLAHRVLLAGHRQRRRLAVEHHLHVVDVVARELAVAVREDGGGDPGAAEVLLEVGHHDEAAAARGERAGGGGALALLAGLVGGGELGVQVVDVDLVLGVV